jgi:hypothetical protein
MELIEAVKRYLSDGNAEDYANSTVENVEVLERYSEEEVYVRISFADEVSNWKLILDEDEVLNMEHVETVIEY